MDYILGELVRKRLLVLLPGLDIQDKERKVFEVARQDVVNYLKVKWRDEIENIRDCMSDGCDYTDDYILSELFMQKLQESKPKMRAIVEELDAWVSLWLKQWQTRTKIIWGQTESQNLNIDKTMVLVQRGSKILDNVDVPEIKKAVIYTLITHNEYVGTEILGDIIIKREAGKLGMVGDSSKAQLDFAVQCIKAAADVTKVSGKTIYINAKGVFYQ